MRQNQPIAIYANQIKNPDILEKFRSLNPLIFINNISPCNLNYPQIMSSDLWHFKGPVISQDVISARFLAECPTPSSKYLWASSRFWKKSKNDAKTILEIVQRVTILTDNKLLFNEIKGVFKNANIVFIESIDHLRDVVLGKSNKELELV